MQPRGPGMFCWLDIKTRDVAATCAMLTDSLGWRLTEQHCLRAAAVLTLMDLPVASLSDLSSPIYAAGIPEHLAWYFAVDDIGVRTSAAIEAGAQLVVEPFDLPALGAISTIVDPFGVVVSLWEQRGFAGWTHAPGTPNSPAAPQHHGPDPTRAHDFYLNLGLNDPEATFVRAPNAAWALRINGRTHDLRTPGGIVMHGA